MEYAYGRQRGPPDLRERERDRYGNGRMGGERLSRRPSFDDERYNRRPSTAIGAPGYSSGPAPSSRYSPGPYDSGRDRDRDWDSFAQPPLGRGRDRDYAARYDRERDARDVYASAPYAGSASSSSNGPPTGGYPPPEPGYPPSGPQPGGLSPAKRRAGMQSLHTTPERRTRPYDFASNAPRPGNGRPRSLSPPPLYPSSRPRFEGPYSAAYDDTARRRPPSTAAGRDPHKDLDFGRDREREYSRYDGPPPPFRHRDTGWNDRKGYAKDAPNNHGSGGRLPYDYPLSPPPPAAQVIGKRTREDGLGQDKRDSGPIWQKQPPQPRANGAMNGWRTDKAKGGANDDGERRSRDRSPSDNTANSQRRQRSPTRTSTSGSKGRRSPSVDESEVALRSPNSGTNSSIPLSERISLDREPASTEAKHPSPPKTNNPLVITLPALRREDTQASTKPQTTPPKRKTASSPDDPSPTRKGTTNAPTSSTESAAVKIGSAGQGETSAPQTLSLQERLGLPAPTSTNEALAASGREEARTLPAEKEHDKPEGESSEEVTMQPSEDNIHVKEAKSQSSKPPPNEDADSSNASQDLQERDVGQSSSAHPARSNSPAPKSDEQDENAPTDVQPTHSPTPNSSSNTAAHDVKTTSPNVVPTEIKSISPRERLSVISPISSNLNINNGASSDEAAQVDSGSAAPATPVPDTKPALPPTTQNDPRESAADCTTEGPKEQQEDVTVPQEDVTMEGATAIIDTKEDAANALEAPVEDGGSPKDSAAPTKDTEKQAEEEDDAFDHILSLVIENEDDVEGESFTKVDAILEENRFKAPVVLPIEVEARSELIDADLLKQDLETHATLEPSILQDMTNRDTRRGIKIVRLRQQYREIDDEWQTHCAKLEKIRSRQKRRQNVPAAPLTPSIDPIGMPFVPTPATPSILGTSSRANRRNAASSLGYGDAARSEAEFLEILASLEDADMRDPNLRAMRTTATVPDMALDVAEKTHLAYEDNNGLVLDPFEHYGLNRKPDVWSEQEIATFCRRYALYPKQFGKIAAALPDKTTAQCVLFYYRSKKKINFRALVDKKTVNGKRKRSKKTGERPDETHAASAASQKKGTSLLANLKRSKGDEEEEEEDDDEPQTPGSAMAADLGLTPAARAVLKGLTNGQQGKSLDDSDQSAPAARLLGSKSALNNGKKAARFLSPSQSDTYTTTTPDEGTAPPSDSAMAAAEALNVLAGFPSEPSAISGTGRATGRTKKRKPSLGDSVADAREGDESVSKLAGLPSKRIKSHSSSYWSVADKNEFIRLLGLHGKNYQAIASGIESKTAIQCKNFYQNNVKKLDLAKIAARAEEDLRHLLDADSVRIDTNGEVPSVFMHPTDSESATTKVPSGFFTSREAIARELEPERHTPSGGGMHLRNLLNDGPDAEGGAARPFDDYANDSFRSADLPIADESSATEEESDPAKSAGIQRSASRRSSNADVELRRSLAAGVLSYAQNATPTTHEGRPAHPYYHRHQESRLSGEGAFYSTASVARSYTDERPSPPPNATASRLPSVLQDNPQAHPIYAGLPPTSSSAAYTQMPERRAWPPYEAEGVSSRSTYSSQPLGSSEYYSTRTPLSHGRYEDPPHAAHSYSYSRLPSGSTQSHPLHHQQVPHHHVQGHQQSQHNHPRHHQQPPSTSHSHARSLSPVYSMRPESPFYDSAYSQSPSIVSARPDIPPRASPPTRPASASHYEHFPPPTR